MIVCDTGPIVAAAIRQDDDFHACTDLCTGLHHFRAVRRHHTDSFTLMP